MAATAPCTVSSQQCFTLEGSGRQETFLLIRLFLSGILFLFLFLIFSGNYHQTHWPVSHGHLELQGLLAKRRGIITTGPDLHDSFRLRVRRETSTPLDQGSAPNLKKTGVSGWKGSGNRGRLLRQHTIGHGCQWLCLMTFESSRQSQQLLMVQGMHITCQP